MHIGVKLAGVILACLCVAGCGGYSADVTGKVTCGEKPVVGSIMFSPKGEDNNNKGPAVSAPLDEEGVYQIRLRSIGPHRVIVTPRDVKFPAPPGQWDYPCDRTPTEQNVTAGQNEINIEMSRRQ
jgi:hypothetical protein